MKKYKKLIIPSLVIFLIVSLSSYRDYVKRQREILQEKIDYYQAIIDSELQWLADLQVSNGAFAFHSTEDGNTIFHPYFSSFTALAFLRADKEKRYEEVVTKYMDWHFAHLNSKENDINGIGGTIYDYEGKIKDRIVLVEESKYEYDSIDSYAATFLMLLWEFYEYKEDEVYLLKHHDEIISVIGAIQDVMDDGLTYAKPDYKVKYLMDNSEVYYGLISGANLVEKVFVPGFEKDSQSYNDARILLNALEEDIDKLESQLEKTMWNEKEGHYEVALGDDGIAFSDFDWNEFYPSAVAQMFPIIFEVIDPKEERAQELYEVFSNYYIWQGMNHYLQGDSSFYWGEIPYAAAIMKDEKRIKEYMDYYKTHIMSNHEYPLYNGAAAWVIMACDRMKENYEEEKGNFLFF